MKKIDMTVTKRDKHLLIVLLAAIIGFLCFNYVISPALETASKLKTTSDTLRAELSKANALIAQKSSIETEENNKKLQLSEKYATFFYELNQERILYQMDTLIQQSGLPVLSYIPSKSVVSSISVPISQYSYTKYPLLNYAIVTNPTLVNSIDKGQAVKTQNSTTAKTELSEESIPTFDITLNFSSARYSSIMDFIKKLETMNKAIIIKKIDIHQAETNLSGQIVISIYSMPKVDESESSYLEFLPSSGNGKVDPFQ